MIIYNKPNYQLAEEKAYETILNSSNRTLPINLKKIINQFDNLHLVKYSVFAWENGLTIDETCELLDSEEGCLWRRNDNQYTIFYNDTVQSKERVRFTIAHEIGHFVLGHLEFGDKTSVMRYSLTELENDAFEKEANYFAKRLLSPLPLVYDFAYIWNKISASLIMELFDVSFTVSNYIIGDLHRARTNGISRVIHELSDQFSEFVNKIKYALWCNNCNFSFSKEGAKYCPICGKDNLISDSIFVIRRSDNMIYPGHELDNEMRAKQCPKCKNDEVTNDYCKICGMYLFNVCTGINPYNRNSQLVQGYLWGEDEDGCEGFLEGNARYCNKCGSTSSFYEEGVLIDWNKKPEEDNQFVSTNGDPFSSVPNINDDDLPF